MGAVLQVTGTETATENNSDCGQACFREGEEFGVHNEEGLGVAAGRKELSLVEGALDIRLRSLAFLQ